MAGDEADDDIITATVAIQSAVVNYHFSCDNCTLKLMFNTM